MWDNTFPPDTQLANQLGQDLRSFRLDTQQRLQLVGTLANRPTPDAGFGHPGIGMLYVAYDTGQFFRWDGATWQDLTAAIAVAIGGLMSNTKVAAVSGVVLAPSSDVTTAIAWDTPFADADYFPEFAIEITAGWPPNGEFGFGFPSFITNVVAGGISVRIVNQTIFALTVTIYAKGTHQ